MNARVTSLVLSALLVGAGCSSGNDATDSSAAGSTSSIATTATTTVTTAATATTTEQPLAAADAATLDAIVTQIGSSPPGCDALDTRSCVLPFPSDATTIEDASSTTAALPSTVN